MPVGGADVLAAASKPATATGTSTGTGAGPIVKRSSSLTALGRGTSAAAPRAVLVPAAPVAVPASPGGAGKSGLTPSAKRARPAGTTPGGHKDGERDGDGDDRPAPVSMASRFALEGDDKPLAIMMLPLGDSQAHNTATAAEMEALGAAPAAVTKPSMATAAAHAPATSTSTAAAFAASSAAMASSAGGLGGDKALAGAGKGKPRKARY